MAFALNWPGKEGWKEEGNAQKGRIRIGGELGEPNKDFRLGGAEEREERHPHTQAPPTDFALGTSILRL